jgi:hypothetical protein
LIFLNEFFWKNSVDFWQRKLTLKVQFRHFLTNHNSLKGCFKTIYFEHVDSWAKLMHFRTKTELTLLYVYYLYFSIEVILFPSTLQMNSLPYGYQHICLCILEFWKLQVSPLLHISKFIFVSFEAFQVHNLTCKVSSGCRKCTPFCKK